jgi:hypothetical protein
MQIPISAVGCPISPMVKSGPGLLDSINHGNICDLSLTSISHLNIAYRVHTAFYLFWIFSIDALLLFVSYYLLLIARV